MTSILVDESRAQKQRTQVQTTLSFDINNPSTYRLQNFDSEGELDSELSFSTTRETPWRFNVARLDYKGNTNKDITEYMPFSQFQL